MALVMLPCELPWWGTVQNHLTKISGIKSSLELIDGMQKIHQLCNISLDPDDEEKTDPELFMELLHFLDNEITGEERSNFFNNTLGNIAQRALNLKIWKPRNGLHFSLQQQTDSTELEYNFVSSLIANAFFSTFPKRTEKSHPTLQNFNFTNFFKCLNSNIQKAKFRSILHYFDWLDSNDMGNVKITRQVMSSKEWLTIENWLECSLPLCQLQIKHEGKLERADEESLQICFSTSKIGGDVLSDGKSQECINFVTFPEILSLLLHVEALEDNEVLTIENVRHISRITDPKTKPRLEKIEKPMQATLCCVDAENYRRLPVSQYEEDNILRELNKCLLAFQQNKQIKSNKEQNTLEATTQCLRRRLSPIGESVSSSTEPQDYPNIPLITQQTCSTNKSPSPAPKLNDNRLNVIKPTSDSLERRHPEGTLNNRRGKFIVLGSSGECLPVKRKTSCDSLNSSCSSGEYHSAKTSLDGSGDEDFNIRYSIDLETTEGRLSFAQRLRDALNRENSSLSASTESSYAVGIAIDGSDVEDPALKVRRGGSTGFMLNEEHIDDVFLKESLEQEQQWIDKFKTKQSTLSKRDSNKSSEYSFSSDSELEEVYEQFSRWLHDPILETDKGTKRVLDQRDLAVVQFAGSLLKRALSESFAGVALTEGCENIINSGDEQKKNKTALNVRSLSLELAKQKHRLAAQLIPKIASILVDCKQSNLIFEVIDATKVKGRSWAISMVSPIVQTLEDVHINIMLPQFNHKLCQISQKPQGGIKAITTGNWGCGLSGGGEVQLKVVIQWLAASVAGVPALIYYTYGHKQLVMLDTVCRILIDRKWTVRDLAQAVLRYASEVMTGRNANVTLFEELIGVERTV